MVIVDEFLAYWDSDMELLGDPEVLTAEELETIFDNTRNLEVTRNNSKMLSQKNRETGN